MNGHSRTWRVMMWVVAVSYLVGFAVMLWLGQQVRTANARRDRENCELRNDGRQAVKETFLDIIELSDPTRSKPITVQFEQNLNARLAPLEC